MQHEDVLTFADIFCGIGGFRQGFESAGCRCVFSADIDKFVRKAYSHNYGEDPEGDVREIDAESMPDFDILCAGFPCPSFSIAGVSKLNSLGRPHGFSDVERGSLFFEVCRIIEAKRPKAFLLENVKNLLHHDQGRTFWRVQEILAGELGYFLSWMVFDSIHWTCQHRERVFIAGFREEVGFDMDDVEVPDGHHVLGECLETEVPDKYTLSDKFWQWHRDHAERHGAQGHGFTYTLAGPEDTTRTLTSHYHKDGGEILIPQEGKNPRRLTPRECARLQGFPEDFDIVVSDTQAYRQFGNAVTVPVVAAIADEMVFRINAHTWAEQGEEPREGTDDGR